jgi:L-lactate dehydrogenase (cytochrome)
MTHPTGSGSFPASPAFNRRRATIEARFPTVADLHKGARSRVPAFVMESVDGGSGDDAVVRRNRAAFDAVQIVPRHGSGFREPSTTARILGREYAAPFGIAPMGLGALVRPRLEELLARAAQSANIPYVLSTAASASIETIGRLAPDVLWFQLFGLPREDHSRTFDLMRRAGSVGATTLVLTVDTPVQARRPQDLRNRLTAPFRPGPTALLQMLRRPRWLADIATAGTPGCESLRPYLGENATTTDLVRFARAEIEGGFSWDLVRRIRDRWAGSLVVKGVLHLADAMEAVAAGADGIIVSNHGGRTFDAAPASLDMLPLVSAAVGGEAVVMMDSGVRDGLDVVRSVARGAAMVFLGRPFLYAAAVLGEEGGDYLIALLNEEVERTMCQIGVADIAALVGVETRGTGTAVPAGSHHP